MFFQHFLGGCNRDIVTASYLIRMCSLFMVIHFMEILETDLYMTIHPKTRKTFHITLPWHISWHHVWNHVWNHVWHHVWHHVCQTFYEYFGAESIDGFWGPEDLLSVVDLPKTEMEKIQRIQNRLLWLLFMADFIAAEAKLAVPQIIAVTSCQYVAQNVLKLPGSKFEPVVPQESGQILGYLTWNKAICGNDSPNPIPPFTRGFTWPSSLWPYQKLCFKSSRTKEPTI